jgi:hypothetical protein
MFASGAEMQDLKELIKSLAASVEDLTTEVKLMRREIDELRAGSR